MQRARKKMLDEALLQAANDLLADLQGVTAPEVISRCRVKDADSHSLVEEWERLVPKESAREKYVRTLLQKGGIPYGAKATPPTSEPAGKSSEDVPFSAGWLSYALSAKHINKEGKVAFTPFGTPIRLTYRDSGFDSAPRLGKALRERSKWLRLLYPVVLFAWLVYLFETWWPIAIYFFPQTGPPVLIENEPPLIVWFVLFLVLWLILVIESELQAWRKWRRDHPDWMMFLLSRDGKSVGRFLFSLGGDGPCKFSYPLEDKASWNDWEDVPGVGVSQLVWAKDQKTGEKFLFGEQSWTRKK